MKSIFGLFLLTFFFVGETTNAQSGFFILDSARVLGLGVAVQDTGLPAPGYRFWENTNYSAPTPNLTSYGMWNKTYTTLRQIPPKVAIDIMAPSWVRGVFRVAIALDDGNQDSSWVSQLMYIPATGNWNRYEFLMVGLNKVKFNVNQDWVLQLMTGNLENNEFLKIETGTKKFNRLRIALSYITGETGVRVAFLDNIRLLYSSTDSVLIDDGSGTGGTTIPTAPTLGLPTNGATNITLNPTFFWGTVTGAINYTIQVTKGDGSVVAEQTTTTNTYTIPAGLLINNTTYYWRVRAGNSAGWSDWSSTWSFTTTSGVIVPNIPALGNPPDGTTGFPIDGSGILNWGSVTGATSYRVQVIEDPSGNVVFDKTTTSTYANPTGLICGGKRYLWRVNATNTAGTSDWSATRSFYTISCVTIPPAPMLLSPNNNSTGNSLTVNLLWSAPTGATSYDIQVGTNSSFSNIIFEKVNWVSNNVVTSPLLYATTYYWRVRSKNSAGWSGWSSIFNFMTIGTTSVDQNEVKKFELYQNYPNPFNPVTVIKYQIPKNSLVSLKVFDILGSEIAVLVNEEKPTGNYEVEFNASNFPSGTYFFQLRAGDFIETKKMILVK